MSIFSRHGSSRDDDRREPVQPEPVVAEPVTPEPAAAEPVAPEPVAAEPVTSVPDENDPPGTAEPPLPAEEPAATDELDEPSTSDELDEPSTADDPDEPSDPAEADEPLLASPVPAPVPTEERPVLDLAPATPAGPAEPTEERPVVHEDPTPPDVRREPTTSTQQLPALDDAEVLAAAEGRHAHPHALLGEHTVDGVTVVRVVRPLAGSVSVTGASGESVVLTHHAHGLWQGLAAAPLGGYQVTAEYEGGAPWVADDPYRFSPTVGDLDLYLFGEGRHEQLWTVLGSHVREHEGVRGTSFAVWAPHAQAVRVVGDLNGWWGDRHAMRRLDDNGVWELFVPGVDQGSYKYQILTPDGEWVERADPMARRAEVPPATASVITEAGHDWGDDAWLERRAATDQHAGPMSVYELHVGSWRPGLGFRELADPLVDYVTALGFTHVEFMPLAQHPFGGSWGYQVTGYYAPQSTWGSPDDLRYLIDRLHQAGIGVIVDWVPGHFPKDEWALGRFDGRSVYEHSDPRRGEQPDWGTYVFNFGDSQVRNFLVANALYWFEEFHVDGLRVDAVASMLYLDYSRNDGEWLPNEHGGREATEAISFLQETNATAYRRHPGIVMIAEESTSWPGVSRPTSEGGLGFGLKWNMGWMHDTLDYVEKDPLYRSYHHGEITFSFHYAWSENFMLPISHDEVVYGKGSLFEKMPGDDWQKRANLRAYLAYMWGHPGKQLLFMGSEFGQPTEWSQELGLDWSVLDRPQHQQVFDLVSRLNQVYTSESALWAHDFDTEGFEWIDGGAGEQSVVAFLRKSGSGDSLAVLANFSGQPQRMRFGLPEAGTWDEVLNTDATIYGGSGVGNFGAVTAVDSPWAGRPASADVQLPPLGVVWLKLRR
ncbi:1,4-alpha-glucan branching protein GlgB [Frigoribacterium sp. CFBP 13729]|uniref:1,4-alpha-glucan branching protein GlgB n=1 Tax=Frigoribacterium sp. CFBP 13729 TaxID=2775293 RepID=UPI0017808BB9|nr:1,4-alpha-glucan branching protein GlgB [Frigoribacterium sp. CFBP 13729]MBD8609566.1 1,4-alpha-glucan branching protein GlgB [Frigoribacterium sp. CFBP 13729]